MDEQFRQLEQQATRERRALEHNLRDLEDRAREFADWRGHYRDHVWPVLGVACGLGLAIGAMSGGRSPRRARSARSDGYTFDRAALDVGTPRETRAPRRPLGPIGPRLAALDPDRRLASQVHTTWNHVLDAAMGVAADRAVSFLSGLIPGFSDHYREPEREANERRTHDQRMR